MTRRITKLLSRRLRIVVAVTIGSSGTAHAAGETDRWVSSTRSSRSSRPRPKALEGAELTELDEQYEGICRGLRGGTEPAPSRDQRDHLGWPSASSSSSFFIWAKGFPAIKKGMNDRTERIRDDLDAAENAKAEAAGVLAEYKAQLADAQPSRPASSRRPVKQADAGAAATRKPRLQTDIAEMRTRAAADIEAAKAQAIADLRGEVAALAIGAAEPVVERNLDQATQVPLVEDYINQVSVRPEPTELMADDRTTAYADGPLRGRQGRRHARRGRRRAVPVRPGARGQRRAA